MTTEGAACRYSFYDHFVCSHLDPLPVHERGFRHMPDGSWRWTFARSQLVTKALRVDIVSASVWVCALMPALRSGVHAVMTHARSPIGTRTL